MTGQIPSYGQHFALVSLPYSPILANRAYTLKANPDWYIRSDKTSKCWRVYHCPAGGDRELAAPVGTPLTSMGLAMARLLEGIDQGFYALFPGEDT